MGMLHEIRRRGRQIVGPFLGVCLLAYFAYHVVEGDRGLIAWARVTQEITTVRAERDEQVAEQRRLEGRAALLRPESLNRDMLDEQSRRMLNVVGPEETVIFLPRPIAR